jgi:hypothetical protein
LSSKLLLLVMTRHASVENPAKAGIAPAFDFQADRQEIDTKETAGKVGGRVEVAVGAGIESEMAGLRGDAVG